MIARRLFLRASRPIVLALALLVLLGCVSVVYQSPGKEIAPRGGKTLVFGRLRFFHDGHEFFPWNVNLLSPPAGTRIHRHVWLLRLERRAISAEVHPDPDGWLVIWIAGGDYALLGSTYLETSGTAPYEVLALLRIPAGPVAVYAGELTMTTESHEGGHVSFSEMGARSVALLPADAARAALEERLGTLPEPPVISAWCVGDHLPDFNDPALYTRAREILDRVCADVR